MTVLRLAAVLSPMLVTTGVAVWFGAEHYRRGADFVPWLHVFGYFLAAVAAGMLYLAFGLTSLSVVLPGRCPPAIRRVGVGSLVVGLAAAVSTPAICSTAFVAGRERAYRELDAQALAAACRRLAAGYGSRRCEHLRPSDDGYRDLPDAIRRLHPLTVHVGSRGVALHMDGGGVATQEGLIVFSTATAGTANLDVLSVEHGVYRYGCDAIWTLLEPDQ